VSAVLKYVNNFKKIKMSKINFEPEKGINVTDAAKQAIKLAKDKETDVNLIFNETEVTVSKESYHIDIAEIHFLKLDLARLKK